MTPEEGAQTFQTDDVHYPDLGRAPEEFKKYYPDLGNEASSVWNFLRSFLSTSFHGENSGDVAKCRQFSQASTMTKGNFQSVENWRD